MTPSQRNQNILRAARAQFSHYGAFGTRIEAILETAQVNKRHLYEFCRTKESLYMATLSDVSREVEEAFGVCSREWISFCKRDIYLSFIRFLLHYREFLLLWCWEELSPTIHGPRLLETMRALWTQTHEMVFRRSESAMGGSEFESKRAAVQGLCEMYLHALMIRSLKEEREDEGVKDAFFLASYSVIEEIIKREIQSLLGK